MAPISKKTLTENLNFSRFILIFCLSILLFTQCYFGYRLFHLSDRQEQLKSDFAQINNITLGLFSIDQWDDKIEGIIRRQTNELDLTPQQKKELQKEIEAVIIALIDKAEALVTQPEKKSVRGKLVKFAVKNFVKIDSIKKQVPGIARTIMKKVDDPDNKKQLRAMALEKLDNLEENEKIDSMLTTAALTVNKIYKKYQITTKEQFEAKVATELKDIQKSTYAYSIASLICVVIVLYLWWALRKLKPLHAPLFIMSLLFAFVLLFIGLTASMIEVDARINIIDFTLLGQEIHFEDQGLFFQSKSILDVVVVLITGSGVDSIAVGVLILAFSILFPVMKLSSTGIHLLGNKKWAENKVIKYFAFQSGKWSMADVIVIAILMAYIGLNGLLENQLAKLGVSGEGLTLISTHNTALQPGYILFIAFVLFGLALSTILKFITPHNAD